MKDDQQLEQQQVPSHQIVASVEPVKNLSETPTKTKTNLPSMKILIEWALLKAGDVIYLKNRVEDKATVIDDKSVNYKGSILSFNQWGQQVTGWKSICIYDWIIVEGQTETLGVLRRNKMMA